MTPNLDDLEARLDELERLVAHHRSQIELIKAAGIALLIIAAVLLLLLV